MPYGEFQPTPERPVQLPTDMEGWRFGYGDYKGVIAGGFEISDKPEGKHSVEGLLDFTINYLVNQRREAIAQNKEEGKVFPPIILMDFGSTQAHSFVRLAKEHRAEIEASELLLGCSNLTHAPDRLDEESYYDGNAGLTFAAANLRVDPDYYETVKLIQWKKGIAQDLVGQTVQTPDGKNWPLEGNVSAVCEQAVFRHITKNKDDTWLSRVRNNSLAQAKKEHAAIQALKTLLVPDGFIFSSDISNKKKTNPGKTSLLEKKFVLKGDSSPVAEAYERYIASDLLAILDEKEKKLRELLTNGQIPEDKISAKDLKKAVTEEMEFITQKRTELMTLVQSK